MSIGLIGILGLKTSSPEAHPVVMIALFGLGDNVFRIRIIQLHNLGGSKSLRSIIGTLTFRKNLCGGVPGGSRELRNSVGFWTTRLSSGTELYS